MYVCDCAGGRENDVTVSWGMKEFIWLTHGNHRESEQEKMLNKWSQSALNQLVS